MAGQNKTPEIILDEFKRYIRAENSRRRGGFGFNFDTDEGKRFVDQIRMLDLKLSGLTLSEPELIPLEREVHYPEELTEEQLLYYCSRRPCFAAGVIRQGEKYYAGLYLLELANELHHSSAKDALGEIFAFWDRMNQSGSDGPGTTGFRQSAALTGSPSDPSCVNESDEEYLRRLCLSFLTAHYDMAEEIRKGLVERDLYWKYDLIGEIRQGRFSRAGLFVKKYARLLKKEEISGDKAYVDATWKAMPEVFASLDSTFGDKTGHLFRKFLTAGEETGTRMELLPVRRRVLGAKRRIALADTCYLDSRPSYGSAHKEQWVRTEWSLKEGARDFLYVIHLYTESFVREYYRAPRRKRTADRFLKKKYLRTGDEKSVIFAMKEILKDERFERAIGQGVSEYMKRHPVLENKKSLSKKDHDLLLYQMDHEGSDTDGKIDYERFKKAKSDADSVLHLLHHDEIDYN